MIGASSSTMRRHLSVLVEKGYIDERHNPKVKWDRKLQYRPNFQKLKKDLKALGYPLEGYSLLNE